MTTKSKSEARELTEEESRKAFLNHIKDFVEYWNRRAGGKKEALEGLASSVLGLIDSGSMELPAFLLMPASSDEERLIQLGRGNNWFPENCDIAGSLKDDYMKMKR